ncbi:MAG: asparagine synthetase B [Clostridia bacterium]|nr:asparagine synthetase B [Clostridia bacterium]
MNFFGVYHSDYSRSNSGIFDAPCITVGRMMLCARGAYSRGSLLALSWGRLRNRRALAGGERDSDAERVLLAYERWGEDYPRHLEGPVVSCVMDAGNDILVLSRDRMGEKPVFYARQGDSLAFSDHPDVLLKAAKVEPSMDADGLRELFGLGPARTPGRTPYKNMQALEPGSALVVRGGRVEVRKYWRIEDVPHDEEAAATIRYTRELLEQCAADVAPLNPAVMLSGGLDSTALTALLKDRVGTLRSFSVDYQDNARDFRANAFRPEMDAPYVLAAARACGTQHRTVTLAQQELAAGLDRAVSLRGFPGMADIDTSLMLFAEQIARFDGSVVSGECGDEVFGGYPWFKGNGPLEDFPWSGSLALRESLLLPELCEVLRLREYVADVFSTRKAMADPGGEYDPEARRLRTLQRLCFEFFMPNLQERAQRMCDGAGLAVLTPLCDERLVQYVYNVPWEMKFMGGQEKGLFREAVADLLPDKLLRRTKSPYPKTCSPEYSGIVRRMALKLAGDGDAPIFSLIDRSKLKKLAQSALDPVDTPWFGQLMAGPQLLGYLWQVNSWLRERNVNIVL